jgi:hypothetical protein
VRDGVEVTGHCLREKLRVRKVSRGQIVVQLMVVAHGYDYNIDAAREATRPDSSMMTLKPLL